MNYDWKYYIYYNLSEVSFLHLMINSKSERIVLFLIIEFLKYNHKLEKYER